MVLTGADPVFCAGLDIAEISGSGADLAAVGDGRSPGSTNRSSPRDTSTAAIAASALLELNGHQRDPAAKKRYTDAARNILTSLSGPTYAPRDQGFAAMPRHGTQNFLKKQADTGIVFSDYYFAEALKRYEEAGGPTEAFRSE